MAAKVTLGFVKDARSHIDIQGFNVYHKNRLIKVVVGILLYTRGNFFIVKSRTWLREHDLDVRCCGS